MFSKKIYGPPGTGKTHALIAEAAQMLSIEACLKHELMFLSFTKKAAQEALQRMYHGDTRHDPHTKAAQKDFPYFRTIHSLAYRLSGLSGSTLMSDEDHSRLAARLGLDPPKKGFVIEEDFADDVSNDMSQLIFLDGLSRNTLTNQFGDNELADRFSAALKQYKKDYAVIDYTDILERFIKLPTARLPKAKVLMIDECFPAGTQVSGVSIETLKVGNIVSSFNHETHTIESRKVLTLFKKKTSSICEITLENGQKLVCTPNHPIWTGLDYMQAQDLTSGQCIYYHEPNGIKENRCTRQDSRRLRKMQQRSLRGRRSLSKLHKEVSVLQQSLSGTVESGISLHQAKQKQLYEKPCHEEKSISRFNSPWSQTDEARRKRETSAISSINARRKIKLANRVSGSYRGFPQEQDAVSYLLQDRHSLSRTHDSYRSRRIKPLGACKKETGQEERKVLKSIRVESVTLHQQGSSERFESLCPNGEVFNIEVEHNNNYFAEGFLVHNCQDLSKLQWLCIDKLLEMPTLEMLIIAGDDDQCIHSWAGASVENFLNFNTIRQEILSQSYRVPKKIHTLAQNVISKVQNRQQKEYLPRNVEGKIEYTQSLSEIDFKGNSWLILARNQYQLKQMYKELYDIGIDAGHDTVKQWLKLSTIHGAKGGEADNVVLCNSMSNACRSALDGDCGKTKAEGQTARDNELRVWYTGITRAKERLIILDGGKNAFEFA